MIIAKKDSGKYLIDYKNVITECAGDVIIIKVKLRRIAKKLVEKLEKKRMLIS